MTNRKLHIDIFSYAEGQLSEEDSAAAERHLESCNSCREFLVEINGILSVIDHKKKISENPFFFTRVEVRMLRPEVSPVFALRRFVPTMVAALFFVGGVFAGINIGKLYGSGKTSNENLVYETKLFLDDFNQEPIEAYIMNLYPETNDTK